MDVLVLGAGVSGLTTAVCLQEAGHSTTIWAARQTPDTTSDVAAAIWYPYRAEPVARLLVQVPTTCCVITHPDSGSKQRHYTPNRSLESALGWSRRSLAVFEQLVADPTTGVTLLSGYEVFRRPVGDPWWRSLVPSFHRVAPELIAAGYATVYAFTVPLITMDLYLRYLQRRFSVAGGRIVPCQVDQLAEAQAAAAVVVNCTGLGARTLVPDPTVTALRGQILRIAPCDCRHFFLHDEPGEPLTYLVPRPHDCILGGTAEEGNESLVPDGDTATAIVARCAELVPQVRTVPILQHMVGLRPGRATVRLERDAAAVGGPLIHNYGHGGAGVTLSWGCAAEVLALINTLAV